MVFPFPLALVRPTLKSVHKQKMVCSVVRHLHWQPSSSADHQVHRRPQSKSGSRLRDTTMTRIPVSTVMKFNKDECKALDSYLKASCPRTWGLAETHLLKTQSFLFFSFFSYIKLIGTVRVMWLPGNVLWLVTTLMNRVEHRQWRQLCTYPKRIRRHWKSHTDQLRPEARGRHYRKTWRAKVTHDSLLVLRTCPNTECGCLTLENTKLCAYYCLLCTHAEDKS